MEITHFFEALWQLSIAMAPYILFGLAFAGVLHEIVPESIVTKHLGKENILSVIKSTIFGIPLPVCSCGVIPLATSIKKSGASKDDTKATGSKGGFAVGGYSLSKGVVDSLYMYSDRLGFNVTFLTEAERDSIANPRISSIIFNTTDSCLQIYLC